MKSVLFLVCIFVLLAQGVFLSWLLFWHSFMQWHNKNCWIWVFFTSLLLSHLFAFISYLNYLKCLYYQQKVMFDVFCSNKQCNSIWKFIGWRLCMMFWCMLYLCFGVQRFQSMSRPGATDWMPVSRWSTGFSWISTQWFLVHMLWGHCVRWTKAQKQ